MTKPKLAAAKDWKARNIDDWNVSTFCAYLSDKHVELFGVDYAPMRGWRAEQGILGGMIGTQSRTNPKQRTVSNELVKAFIDETFESYTPNAQYPGTSFGFMYTYRKNVLQRLQAEEYAKARRKEAVELAQEDDWDEVSEWL